jgi:hypothetical protein
LVSLTLSRPVWMRRMLEEHRRIVSALETHDPIKADAPCGPMYAPAARSCGACT